MSDPSESEHRELAASPPAPPGETEPQATASDEPSAASSGGESETPRKSPAPIRIGTQRYGVKAPPAVPTPVLPAPPPELLAKAAALSAGVAGPVGAGGEATAESPHPEERAAPPPVEPREPGQPEGSPRRDRTPREAQRGGRGPRDRDKRPAGERAREVKPAIELPTRTVAPPNVRAGLSPDLELEYLEALGEQSLDEIISTSAPQAVAPELEIESRHKGRVITVHRDNVFVEIGGRQQGVVPLKNFANPPEPGATLDVVVSRFNPAEGLYELILPGGAVDVGDWSEVAEGMVVEARVTGHNKGGLECEVNQLRGFIPASQVSMYRVEDLAQFVGEKFHCVITEANPEKRNLVLSRRAMIEREKAAAKEALMASLEVGQTREGTVRSLQDFGAFVDLGGVDGLVHISQLSWDRIKHANEVLEVGQKIKVKIQKIDPNTGKISLGFRDLAENPWTTAARDFPARGHVHGRVTRLMEFGAFVRLGPGVEGLVHISELSHKRVFRVSDVLQEGQDVEVMVLSVDPEAQRISLSLKALEARPSAPAKADEPEESEPQAPAAAPKKRKTPLRGGIGGPPSGEQFGLKW